MNQLVLFLLAAFVFVSSPSLALADEALPTQDLTVQRLADALYEPGYRDFLATRDRLRLIVEEGPRDQAAAAAAVLQVYAENADRWLLKVGNTENAQRWLGLDLPLGQGRIRGKRTNFDFAANLWIKVQEQTPTREMAYLYSYTPVDTVTITGKTIKDAHLRYLSGLSKLRLLEISDTTVSGSFLANADLPNLEFLHIVNSPVQDSSIPTTVLRRLSTADFQGTLIGNEILQRLSMERIAVLKVSNTAVDAEGVMLLESADQLMSISLDADDLTPAVVEMLSKKESVIRIHIAFRRQQKELAAKLASRFPPRIKIVTHDIADEDYYLTRWNTPTTTKNDQCE
ncbi:MAG: hypothetical protein RIC55_17885 [Pirellulaceae bacterium]